MKQFLKSSKGFTLIEIAMAIALVAIGLTVAVLGYNGYQSWARGNAEKQNAQTLVNAVTQFKTLGGVITGTAADPMTLTRANAIYAQLDGDLSGLVGSADPIEIVPAGFQLPTSASFPDGWGESALGVFEPIP